MNVVKKVHKELLMACNSHRWTNAGTVNGEKKVQQCRNEHCGLYKRKGKDGVWCLERDPMNGGKKWKKM